MSCSDPAQDSVREQLREQLLALPVPAFEHLMARLLGLCGYAEVQVLAGSQGGADLSAATSGGLSRSVTLVQAKQYRSPVSRRFVDELRGAMLRTGAQQGVLLTTSTFFGPAYRAVRKGCPLPVRLVDGAEMIGLLCAHGLGVRLSAQGRARIDCEFFTQLRRTHGSGPRPQQRPHAASQPPQPHNICPCCRTRLTIHLLPAPSRRS